MSKARGWNRLVVDDVFSTNHVFDARNTLSTRGVRQHQLTVRVTDAPNTFDDVPVRVQHLALFIGRDESSLRLDFQIVQVQPRSVWGATSGDHARVHFHNIDDFLRRRVG